MIEESSSEDELNPVILNVIFCHLIIANLLINFDHGTIPAALTELRNDLNISNADIGSLGSLVFFGLTLGATITSPL